MSQKFEHIFKEALQNQELPFDPKAWEAMSAHLDKTMPVSSRKPFGPKAATIIAIGLIGAASIWYFASKPQTASEKSLTAEQAQQKSTPSSTAKSVDDAKNQTASSEQNGETHTISNSKANSSNGSQKSTSLGQEQKRTQELTDRIDKQDVFDGIVDFNGPVILPDFNPNDSKGTSTGLNVDVPFVPTSCQFAETKIANTSDILLQVEFPSGKIISIQPKASKTIQLTDAGLYRITNAKGTEKSFLVHENTPADFTVDWDNKYKNGIPTTEVIMTSNAQSAVWNSSFGNQKYTGANAEFHFFKKGTHIVHLTTTNAKGCNSEITKTVSINENYNLMATTAFMPQDIDPRNNTFMPYALTVRQTKFRMIIIDPKDGGIVYETSDASAGWDGIDKRTGKPATHGSNYIWKVTLENPLPGESNDYKGTVMVTIN